MSDKALAPATTLAIPLMTAYLPWAASISTGHRPTEIDGGSESNPNARIAVLDDNCAAAQSVAALLCRLSLQATAYCDAEALLAESRARPFDAYVLDWSLADGTTAPLIRVLRLRMHAACTPIFVLSGSVLVDRRPADPDLDHAVREYHLEFRAKPFSALLLAQQLIQSLRPGSQR
jgi:CheY-like chemotaxis protein